MQNFQNLVLEKSINKPVLVDFWADWCQPCQTIMPMLAKLAEEYDGKFELAKVNADEEQELAAHFGIKSLPTMKLFYQGQIVDERMGAVPESDIRAMIDKHIVSESDQLVQAAMMAYQQGHTEQALEVLNNALAKDPDNAELKVTIAQMVYGEGDSKSAEVLLDSLDDEGSKLDAAIKLRAEIKLAEQRIALMTKAASWMQRSNCAPKSSWRNSSPIYRNSEKSSSAWPRIRPISTPCCRKADI
jgi:putative thioredoxin